MARKRRRTTKVENSTCQQKQQVFGKRRCRQPMGSPLHPFEADIGACAYDVSFDDEYGGTLHDVDKDYLSNVLQHCDDDSSASSEEEPPTVLEKHSSEKSSGDASAMQHSSSVANEVAETWCLPKVRHGTEKALCQGGMPAAGHGGASPAANLLQADLQQDAEDTVPCCSGRPPGKMQTRLSVDSCDVADSVVNPSDGECDSESSCTEEDQDMRGVSDSSADDKCTGSGSIPGVISWWDDPLIGDPALELDDRFRGILTGSFNHLSRDSQSAFTSRLQFYRRPRNSAAAVNPHQSHSHVRSVDRPAKASKKYSGPEATDRSRNHGKQLDFAEGHTSVVETGRSFQQRLKKAKSGSELHAQSDSSLISESCVGSTSAVLGRLRGQAARRKAKLAKKRSRRNERQLQQQRDAMQASHLAAPLPENNVGSMLLRKLGWSPGTGLGAARDGIRVPVTVDRQPGRGGLGYCGASPAMATGPAASVPPASWDGMSASPLQPVRLIARSTECDGKSKPILTAATARACP